jgi:serine/threonine-protein kinase
VEAPVAEVAENTIIDSRYRITSRIGTGGMADVYCAHDEHLGRDVALKILHRRFSQDQEFVERFRREASSAAGLQHPNVVNVYDRGTYDGTYYIAMEFLRGRTLKDVISAEAPLDPDRAIDIAIQILRAAGFAHKRGVIHRDFKPRNVIVDDEGRVKVTDFGIARAGASEITEAGSIMGTAQYLSPEQAQGQPVTEASDLYSIGVLLYEMLSGRIPFTGDSAVAIALRHLTEHPPPLPEAPAALDVVVTQALEKEPERRFQSAEDFIAALEQARGQIQTEPVGQDTAAFEPVHMPVAEETLIGMPPPLLPEEYPYRERRAWPWILLALLLAGLAIAAFALTRPEQRTVPNTVGRDAAQAQSILEQQGFDVNLEREESLSPPDRVIRTEPAGGTRADKGSTVTVVVSSGPPDRVVPSVDRLPLKAAVQRLNKAGFKVDEPVPEASDTIKKGLVTRTTPDGGTVAQAGSRIRIYVSSGAPKVRVPDVVGLTQSAAERALERKSLLPVITRVDSEKPEGEVVAQDPAAQTEIAEGERVTLDVSKGPQTERVPGVVGNVPGDARRELQALGFKVQERDRAVDNEGEDGLVVDQRPAEGTELRKGRTVVIWVGRYEPPPDSFTPPTETTPTP